MATLTRLASTLTAKYFPSKNLTDAFYIDGRLFGKRETRQADITIDKEERGFFFSVFAHPTIPAYEPGTLPPYEPQLRSTCNEVKFGRKEIDSIIEGFLATAVDVTGKMKIIDGEERAPYFSGIIVRDSEAFAVTIGSGLAFLYRDDTLFPLTDAGIPMEPIDCNGNRVADFLYYCSSKTANALWSNFFTLSPDDCIILCNKEVYDALGQRELLRILNEADDQCDAAGVVITQASARMPNVPMQFSISFVESVTSDEKRGLFGFKRKNKNEEDMSDMSITSTFEGGVVGAAAEAVADAGFTSGIMADTGDKPSVLFGDDSDILTAPATNQVASPEKGIEVDGIKTPASGLEFLDESVSTEPIVEISADDMLKNLFPEEPKAEADAPVIPVMPVIPVEPAPAAPIETPFVATGINPFEIASEEVEMKPISTSEINIEESEADKTKAGGAFDFDFLKSLEESLKQDEEKAAAEEVKEDAPVIENVVTEEGISETKVTASSAEVAIKSALEELTKINAQAEAEDIKKAEEAKEEAESEKKEEEVEEKAPATTTPAEIVFSEDSGFIDMTPAEIGVGEKADFGDAFNPYSVGDSDDMQNAAPFVFGDDLQTEIPGAEEAKEEPKAEEIPVPEFEIAIEKPVLKEEDKLAVDFPVKDEEKKPEEEKKSDEFELPFANGVSTFSDDPKEVPGANDIPDMPLYEGNTFDTPVNAVSSDVPVSATSEDVYTYGQYVENENMAENEPVVPVAPIVNVTPESPAPVAAAPVANISEVDNMNENDPMQYQSFGNEGQFYTGPVGDQETPDEAYSYQPGQYQDPNYTEPAPESASQDDDWINAILGIGNETSYDYAETPATPSNEAPITSQQPSAPRRPAGSSVPTSTQRKPGQTTYTSRSGSGNGGKGGSKKAFKLNRNGYMFLAFVIVLLICLIVIISAIVKACGRKEDVVETTEATTEATLATTLATEATTADPSAPIGMFTFSNDYVGFRTWWDLFNQVYGIDDLANESDPRIATIITYNGLDPANYRPNGGDSLLLPPLGVINGQIPNTFQVGGAQNTESTIAVVDGTDATAEGDASAETDAGTAET